LQLAKRTEELKQEGIITIAIQASKVDENNLNEWLKKNNVSLPVGLIQGDEEKMRFNWGVKSLPWLILTNKNQHVRSSGFSFAELDEKIQSSK
jgi:hypothetical protein